jgi:2-polyprenyl-6-hydroxyphenyl methylase/3-demethylubiquinone-9 3-methyltransferase
MNVDTATNLNPDEHAKFSALAAEWWDRDGPCRTLHDINPCRLDYLAGQIALTDARVLDVGCGGGILSEAMAARGARVRGLDASAALIGVARDHAREQALVIEYCATTVEAWRAHTQERYDAVVCMELIEHVPDPDALLGACAALLLPHGTLVVSTLNRTFAAWLGGVVIAEYVLGLLPRGTHDYRQFVRPSELARAARAHGLDLIDVRGMRYQPLTRRATLCDSARINYLATLRRNDG